MRASVDLRKIDLFVDLPPKTIKKLNLLLKLKYFRQGAMIYVQGDKPKGIYYLLSGDVSVCRKISQEEEVLLYKVKENEMFGEIAVITNSNNEDFAHAEKDVQALFLSKADFESIVTKDPYAGLALSILLSRKLKEMQQRIVTEKHKTTLAVFYNEGNNKDKSWLAMETALSLREQTNKRVLLIDMLSNPQNLENILKKKLNFDFILINLTQCKDSVSMSIIMQADFLLNLSNRDLDFYKKFYLNKLAILTVDLNKERKLKRLDWYVGHLARVLSRSTLGLALGSGTVGGLTHLGVMKYLQEKNISIDMIAGCSGGALYGSLFAYRNDFRFVYDVVSREAKKKLSNFLDFAWSGLGFSKDKKLAAMFAKVVPGKVKIEDLKIPLAVVTTNLTKRRQEVFFNGALWPALRASFAIPIIFTPVKLRRDLFVDGNITNPLPVDVLRKKGIDKVIAVYASQKGSLDHNKYNNFVDVYLQSREILNDSIAFKAAKDADVFINPDVSKFGMFEYEKIKELVEAGYQAAKQKLNNFLD